MENDQQDYQESNSPVRIPRDNGKYCRYEKLLYDTYKKDEIIVFFKEPPSLEQIEEVKKTFAADGFDPEMINVRRCDNCDIPVLLFEAKNIHTVINADGVKAGAGTHTGTVGEGYSLNFYNYLPYDKRDKADEYQYDREYTDQKKDTIVVAVLDTGIDTKLVNEGYLWKGTSSDQKCYNNVSPGWNFINDTDDFNDDNKNRHGSIVSQYIINQFRQSPYNNVQIMPLKTHDSNGISDLFSIICAIHFAMAKGANIINASWGFYYYFETPMPYLQKLITETLREKGILFVTAAGNKVDQEDVIANQIYYSEHKVKLTAEELRNLVKHNFYPAHLSSDENSVITTTTTDGEIVTTTQNYSNVYADLGVKAELVTKDGHMLFRVPFAGSSEFISGSSFATAITSGVIGAFCEKNLYTPNINKSDFFNFLSSIGSPGVSDILFHNSILEKRYIKKGVFIKNMSP